jgi:pSer/pThr/pTyr-binding forkhead associated (FHA) protein
MEQFEDITQHIDQSIIRSRLNALACMMMTSPEARLQRIALTLDQLRPGAYLIGTGPSTVGILSLSTEETVLGRLATPVEEPADTVIDYLVADTMYLTPQEVSRVHAKVLRTRTEDAWEYRLIDLGSRCGTFFNNRAVGDAGHVLAHGDLVSLGPSQTSTFVFVLAD